MRSAAQLTANGFLGAKLVTHRVEVTRANHSAVIKLAWEAGPALSLRRGEVQGFAVPRRLPRSLRAVQARRLFLPGPAARPAAGAQRRGLFLGGQRAARRGRRQERHGRRQRAAGAGQAHGLYRRPVHRHRYRLRPARRHRAALGQQPRAQVEERTGGGAAAEDAVHAVLDPDARPQPAQPQFRRQLTATPTPTPRSRARWSWSATKPGCGMAGPARSARTR